MKKTRRQKAVEVLRKLIGVRGEHHSLCNSRRFGDARYLCNQVKCDCYAKGREEAHKALDVLEKDEV